jgi:transcription antitermination factor NusG
MLLVLLLPWDLFVVGPTKISHEEDTFFNQFLNPFLDKSGRKKILIPLLPGYVFVHFDMNPEVYWDIIKTTGVVRMVSFRGEPVPARDEEVASLMILDGTDRTVQNQAYVKTGDKVMIMEGPLKGLVGFYLRRKGQSDKVVVVGRWIMVLGAFFPEFRSANREVKLQHLTPRIKN